MSMSVCVCVCVPQWQRGQQSCVLHCNSVPSGQEGVSILEQLTLDAEMKTPSPTFTHCCITHLSREDSQTSPTYKEQRQET